MSHAPIRPVRRALMAAGLCLAVAAPAAAQAKSGLMADLASDVTQAKRKIMGLANAMPEAALDWRPDAAARSTKEVLAHIAADNYYIPIAAGAAAPAGTGIGDDIKTVAAFEQRARTKVELIAELEKSFGFLEQQMAAATEASLATPSAWPKMSKQQLWIATTTHLHEHLGQLIAYARSNKITPPWSK